MRLIEIPDDGVIRIPIMDEDAKVGEKRINLSSFPTVDAEPVKHGRWVERKSHYAQGGVVAKCSICQNDVQYLGNPLNYCPNCGAKMDGE